jgi:regulator of protease activity HflC (stomatin/prohibitin superfamily)
MKTIKGIAGILVVVAVFYGAWKLVPPYFYHFQFEEVVETEARAATYGFPPKNEDEIRSAVYAKARGLEIPVTLQQIKVRRSEAGVEIDVNYTVRVDLLMRPVDLNFSASSKNKRI